MEDLLCQYDLNNLLAINVKCSNIEIKKYSIYRHDNADN